VPISDHPAIALPEFRNMLSLNLAAAKRGSITESSACAMCFFLTSCPFRITGYELLSPSVLDFDIDQIDCRED
jgi:hypothetical protein